MDGGHFLRGGFCGVRELRALCVREAEAKGGKVCRAGDRGLNRGRFCGNVLMGYQSTVPLSCVPWALNYENEDTKEDQIIIGIRSNIYHNHSV
jgi:hypothetical protein